VCNNCHKILDPIGFGLENFDAIGRWRDQDDTGGKIDAAGELPGGKHFSSPKELKTIIAARKDDLARNLTEKLLAYALCRKLGGYDELVVDRMMKTIAQDGYKMQTLITEIVTSYPFLNRRVTENRIPAPRNLAEPDRELLFGLAGLADVEAHVSGLQVLHQHTFGADLCCKEMACMHLLELQIGKIQPQAVLRILQHEAQTHRAICELGGMRHGHGMIRLRVDEDAHRAVLQIHLLVAFRTALAVRAPAVAGLVFRLLRLNALEIILKNELAGIFGSDGRTDGKSCEEEKKAVHEDWVNVMAAAYFREGGGRLGSTLFAGIMSG
jgi:hypothetical protein